MRRPADPYFWAILTNPTHRAALLKDGWKSVGKIFVLAIVLDVVYQVIVDRFVYPGEVIIVALLLAIVPYWYCGDWSRALRAGGDSASRALIPTTTTKRSRKTL